MVLNISEGRRSVSCTKLPDNIGDEDHRPLGREAIREISSLVWEREHKGNLTPRKREAQAVPGDSMGPGTLTTI